MSGGTRWDDGFDTVFNYDPSFKGMKNNKNRRPAKYLVNALTMTDLESINNQTTKDYEPNIEGNPSEHILIQPPMEIFKNHYSCSQKTFHDDFSKSKLIIGTENTTIRFNGHDEGKEYESIMTKETFKHYVNQKTVHEAPYGSLKYSPFIYKDIPLMVHSASIITTCHVRPTIDFKAGAGSGQTMRVECIEGDIEDQADIILLNACGIDQGRLGGINVDEDNLKQFLGCYNDSLVEAINQNKITHLCLVQIGLGVFSPEDLQKKNLIIRIYAEGILRLKRLCPNLEFVSLPDEIQKYFNDYHEQFTTEIDSKKPVDSINTKDALALAFHLKQIDSNRIVGYLNPSDSVVIFGSHPVGALCMEGIGDGFVGEEYIGQTTSGILFNSKYLVNNVLNIQGAPDVPDHGVGLHQPSPPQQALSPTKADPTATRHSISKQPDPEQTPQPERPSAPALPPQPTPRDTVSVSPPRAPQTRSGHSKPSAQMPRVTTPQPYTPSPTKKLDDTSAIHRLGSEPGQPTIGQSVPTLSPECNGKEWVRLGPFIGYCQ